MGMTYERLKGDAKKHLAFTGLTMKEFSSLLSAFSRVCQQRRNKQTVEGKQRKRAPGAGQKPILAKEDDQLLFILFYLKTYPLQEVMSELFEMPVGVGTANEWIHRLLPIVQQALDDLGVMPERDASTFADRQCKSPDDKEIIIDGTERRRQRPKDKEKQALHYSGKKKTHTDKNVVIVNRKTKQVSYLSKTYAGTAHDKKIADHEDIRYTKGTILHKDTGFQGYEPDLVQTHQPKKTSRTRIDACAEAKESIFI